jgi:hypothetical protein
MTENTAVPSPDEEEMSAFERRWLWELEADIHRAGETLREVSGDALVQIRDRHLYREHYPTFEDYVTSQWPQLPVEQAYRLIEAAMIAAGVLPGSRTGHRCPKRGYRERGS